MMHLMTYANNKKASQYQEQYQTTLITTITLSVSKQNKSKELHITETKNIL